MKIELMRKIEVVPIGSIKPYENNPRVNDDAVMDDDRYYCYQARDNNRGGNAQFRSKEGFEKSVDTLLAKWGRYLKKKCHQGQIGLSLQVKRKQVINEIA